MKCELGLFHGNPSAEGHGLKASARHPWVRVSVSMCVCLGSKSKTA